MTSILRLIELLQGVSRISSETILFEETRKVLQGLLNVLSLKHTDLIRKADKIIAALSINDVRSNKPSNFGPAYVDPHNIEGDSGGQGTTGMLPKLNTSMSRTLPPRLGSTPGNGNLLGSGDNSSSHTLMSTSARNADVTGLSLSQSTRNGENFGQSARNNDNNTSQRKSLTAMRFFLIDDSTVPRKLYPLHPAKALNNNGMSAPRLLETWPNFLEKLNVNHGISRAFVSSPSSAERMHLTYESGSAAGKGVQSRAYTPVPYVVPPEGCGEPFGHSLTFDSEFESGNLLRAVQRGDASYDLFLRADLHTEGHTQWFYFSVSNTHPAALVKLSEQGVQVPPVRVRFNLVNFTKPDSLFNLGMRPVVYSCVDASTKGIGWVRSGSEINYFSNAFSRNNSAGEGNGQYYTLSFTIEFQHPKDTVLIAYSYPYSLTDYKSHIGT